MALACSQTGWSLLPAGRRNPPAPARAAGTAQRFDDKYQRNGTANLFIFFQPLAGGTSRSVNGGPSGTSPGKCQPWWMRASRKPSGSG